MGPSGHPNVYIQKIYIGPQASATSRYKKSAHQPIKKVYKVHTYIRVPLSHPQLLLPQEEVVAHPHLPQVVVVEHLQDPPAPAAGVHWSSRRAQLLVALYPAMVEVVPMHCSRNPSSWIRIHMPSGTSCNTVSRRRRMSSTSTPAAAGGA
jgi:hypothetical protein